MKKQQLVLILALVASAFTLSLQAKTLKKSKGEIYQLSVYHFKNNEQLAVTELYLKNSYLPALHKMGFEKIGVFATIGNDTALDKKLYVFITLKNMQQLQMLAINVAADDLIKQDATGYTKATYDKPPYERIETIILKSFDKMPVLQTPQLTAPLAERVYELRSYEASTETLYRQKIKMFNAGGEVDLFKRLGFNAVFYAEVLVGAKMPNLMYMTTFNNKAERDAHWKNFSADAEWKTLSGLPEYQHTVSKADIFFLHPTSYSDY